MGQAEVQGFGAHERPQPQLQRPHGVQHRQDRRGPGGMVPRPRVPNQRPRVRSYLALVARSPRSVAYIP